MAKAESSVCVCAGESRCPLSRPEAAGAKVSASRQRQNECLRYT